MTINFGIIEFDEGLMLRQLRHDMNDDWLPDVLLFEDAISTERLRQRIEANFDQNHGAYIPGSRDFFNVPKPDSSKGIGIGEGLQLEWQADFQRSVFDRFPSGRRSTIRF